MDVKEVYRRVTAEYEKFAKGEAKVPEGVSIYTHIARTLGIERAVVKSMLFMMNRTPEGATTIATHGSVISCVAASTFAEEAYRTINALHALDPEAVTIARQMLLRRRSNAAWANTDRDRMVYALFEQMLDLVDDVKEASDGGA